jgi:hypothetical protein
MKMDVERGFQLFCAREEGHSTRPVKGPLYIVDAQIDKK